MLTVNSPTKYSLLNSATYGAVFLISCAILILEIALTKIFSITLWYHFSYFVISLAMFGCALGGLLIYPLKNLLLANINKSLSHLSALLALSIVINLQIVVSFEFYQPVNWVWLLLFLEMYLFNILPYLLSSMIVSLLLFHTPKQANIIYSADLLGAALGCLGCVLLITYLTGPQVVLVASLLAMVAAFLFNRNHLYLYQVLGLIALLFLILFSKFWFQVNNTKIYDESQLKIYEQWSPLSRITVFPSIFFVNKEKGQPFSWGMSPTYQAHKLFNQLWIEQDANAGTPIVPFNNDYSQVDFLKYDITAIPYYLRNPARVFILGVGGGRDVLTALSFNNKDITGVDVHPVIINLVKNIYANYAGFIYDKAQIIQAEGRSYLAQNNKKYDIIQIPLIDSWAATVAGAFAMVENSLYTQEAFATYLQSLTPTGLLSITRFYFKPDNQTIKIAILARTSLEKLGVNLPEKNIVVIRTSREQNIEVATVLVKQTPFTPLELNQINQLVDKLKFVRVYLPGGVDNEALFQTALTTPNLTAWMNQYVYDIRPNTDNRPFFFQMVPFSQIKSLLFNTPLVGQTFNYNGVKLLFFLLIISTFLVLVFFIVPCWLQRSTQLSWRWGSYFVAIGLAFMLIEIPVIQIAAVYLGGVTYGLTVALFGLLFFGGLGSLINNKINVEQLSSTLNTVLVIVIFLALGLPFYLHQLMQLTFSWEWGLKLALFLILLTPLALGMGFALPSAIRLSPSLQLSAGIPWYWALNGSASVLGSIIAMASSISFGYSYTLIAGAFFYSISLFIVNRNT